MRLGKLWTKEWPWSPHMGVGVKLTGVPTNEKEFISFLHSESCNPIAARRVLKELKEHGIKKTTLQSSLNFGRMADEFQRLGVKMEVIPPVENPNDTTLDQAALDIARGRVVDISHFSKSDVAEIYRRVAETGPIEEEELGPYA